MKGRTDSVLEPVQLSLFCKRKCVWLGLNWVPENSVWDSDALTVHFQDKPDILAASCWVCDSDHIVSSILQPQVRQAHWTIFKGLYSAFVIYSYVGVQPRLPSPYISAHQSWHKGPLYGGVPAAIKIHWEEHILQHRPGEAPLGRIDGDGSGLQREKDEEMQISAWGHKKWA